MGAWNISCSAPTLSMKPLIVAAIAMALLAACSGEGPTAPSGVGTINFRQVIPPSGSTIAVANGPLGGIFIVRGSGQLSIPMVIRSTRNADWAQLNVYLLTGNTTSTYCGQNLPDSPTWGPWVGGRDVQVTITGFQIGRLPCDVTGIRAMLHLRQGGLLIPPNETQTLAEGILPVQLYLRP
jgi:hypothetical protein